MTREQWRQEAERYFEAAARALESEARSPLGPQEVVSDGLSISATYLGAKALRSGRFAPVPREGSDPLEIARLIGALELPECAAVRARVAAVAGAGARPAPGAEGAPSAGEGGTEARAAALAALAAIPAEELAALPARLGIAVRREVAAHLFAEAVAAGSARRLEDAVGFALDCLRLWPQDGRAAIVAIEALSAAFAGPGPAPEFAREALQRLEARLAVIPLDEPAYLRLADLIEAAGASRAESARVLRAALDRPARSRALRLRLAAAVLERAPADAHASRTIGFAHYLAGDFAAAIPHLEVALAGGEPMGALLGLALVRARKDAARAESLLAPFTKGSEAITDAVLEAARLRYEAGDPMGAEQLLWHATGAGDPHKSRALVLLSRIALERGDVEEADRRIWKAADSCEAEAIETFDRLAAAWRARGDTARANRAEKEARDMRALPELLREFGYISNPVGYPAVVARDPGGTTYRGQRRRSGEQVLIRNRPAAPGESGETIPLPVASPFVLTRLATTIFDGKRRTAYEDPSGRPLSAKLLDARLSGEPIEPLLVGLAAALCDLEAAGTFAGFLIPERVIVNADGGPALFPFDPLDVPVVAGEAPSFSLAPEIRERGAAACSLSADVFAVGAIAQRLLGDRPLGARLARVLAEAASEDPACRPAPRVLFETLAESL